VLVGTGFAFALGLVFALVLVLVFAFAFAFAFALVLVFAFALVFPDPPEAPPWPREEGRCGFPGPTARGGEGVVNGVEGVVNGVVPDEDEDVDVLEDEVVEVEVVEDVDVLEVLEVVETPGGADVGHDNDSLLTALDTGSLIDDTGVPGATSTWKDSTSPDSNTTRTTHPSAIAAGTPTTPSKPTTTPTAPTTLGIRLLNTMAWLLLPAGVYDYSEPRAHATPKGRY
jgi:hypothetical protein